MPGTGRNPQFRVRQRLVEFRNYGKRENLVAIPAKDERSHRNFRELVNRNQPVQPGIGQRSLVGEHFTDLGETTRMISPEVILPFVFVFPV